MYRHQTHTDAPARRGRSWEACSRIPWAAPWDGPCDQWQHFCPFLLPPGISSQRNHCPSFRLFFGEPKLKLHMCVVEVWVTQSCPTLCDPMDYSLPGSSVHGILQARILQWVAMPFSRGSSQPQGSNPGLQHCRQTLYCLNHREVHICVHVS